MPELTRCALWKDADAVLADPMKDRFALLARLCETSHHWRYVLACRGCGQKYFMEFYEEIDWDGGKDPSWTSYVPFETDAELAALNAMGMPVSMEQPNPVPRLDKMWPSKALRPFVLWVKQAEDA